jgi:1,4-alpha-glucan branching enzyme
MTTKFRSLFLIPLIFFAACKKDGPVNESVPFQVPATADIVMYEVNMRAFGPTHDFDAVTARLDAIRDLGVNTLWLMPVHPVGQINSVGQLGSPYAVADYLGVNPEFGTLEDLEELISEAHKRDMAVVIDWVANHTAWDNPWISNTDWYTQNASGEIISPPGTNWNDVADLNFDNQSMRQAMIDALSWWVNEAGIDGFRCDAADFVPYDFWKQAIDSLHARVDRPFIMLAEGARADHFNAGFQMNYAWSFYGTLKNVMNSNGNVAALFDTHLSETGNLPAGTHKLRFTTNHDETAWDNPPPDLFGSQEAALAAFVLTTTIGGVPLIYGGQEVGVSFKVPFFSQSSIDWTANPEVLSAYNDIMEVYTTQPAFRYGETIKHDAGYHMAVYSRKTGNEEVVVVVNPRYTDITATLPAELQGSYKDLLGGGNYTLAESITMEPYSWLFLKK